MSFFTSTITLGMGLTGQLYQLQQIDLELRTKQQELDEVENQLRDNKALVGAESRLASERAQLEEGRRRQRSSEWELEDLREKVRQIDVKLYGGTTKNPKELVNLQREVRGFKSQFGPKEDALLGLMTQVEELEANVKATAHEVDGLRRDWEQRQETLGQRKSEVEAALAELEEERNGLAQQIHSTVLNTYERVRLAKGQALVKVEKGKCQGCHITVPTSQWQKAKAGDLIQCSSCTKILYVE